MSLSRILSLSLRSSASDSSLTLILFCQTGKRSLLMASVRPASFQPELRREEDFCWTMQ